MEYSNSRTFQGLSRTYSVFKDFQGPGIFLSKLKDFQGLLKDPTNPDVGTWYVIFYQHLRQVLLLVSTVRNDHHLTCCLQRSNLTAPSSRLLCSSFVTSYTHHTQHLTAHNSTILHHFTRPLNITSIKTHLRDTHRQSSLTLRWNQCNTLHTAPWHNTLIVCQLIRAGIMTTVVKIIFRSTNNHFIITDY